jgi:hypothetical protein
METLDLLKAFLSNKEIEERCGMPFRTIQPGRGVPDKYHEKMVELYNEVSGSGTVVPEKVIEEKREEELSEKVYILKPDRVHGILTLDWKWREYEHVHDSSLKKRDKFVCLETGAVYYQMPIIYGVSRLALGTFREDGLFVADRSLPKDKQTLKEGMTFRKVLK